MMKKIALMSLFFMGVGTMQGTTWVANYTQEPLLVTMESVVNLAHLPLGGTIGTIAEQIAKEMADWIITLKTRGRVPRELIDRAAFTSQKTEAGIFNFTETQVVMPGQKDRATFSKFDILGVSTRYTMIVSDKNGKELYRRFWSANLNTKTRGGNFTLKLLPGNKVVAHCESFCALGVLPGKDYPVSDKQF